ncbi:cobyrinic acid a,c-diamide synthase [Methanomicrobiaceae archaeon CYW5]|uniref:cobyrinate a,c-diamide synthase n=1 Tax=Methanovulcanius yangii TaxID=1789227 RepID=UPI0029CAA450|nr:cobyrinate a,c-diamide synthase [Methanovulcanius yangii]MBT8507638.1 cobyrinic acid a,c-diamide synthase [Methanovulcanius yangii]
MIPAIIIAGTHSGCGKTTIAGALMSALVNRGLTVQPFKVGPDFIDPTHHTAICGRGSRNLDPYMMGEDGVIATFARASAGADIAVIEGVMGLFDGLEGEDTGSTAHVAKILGCPVILVVDAKGASRSVNAMVKGFATFDPEVTLGGVIFNRVGSPRHGEMISASLVKPAFGCVPWERERSIESRHLGLQMAHESSAIEEFRDILEDNCDIDAILAIGASRVSGRRPAAESGSVGDSISIGVAYDAAFNFYYADNFERLRRQGAELVFFSPLTDRLPEVDALYFGGGYPELHTAELEQAPCRDAVTRAADAGMPIYAECGGLTYLTESIEMDGTRTRMCGVIPAETVKMGRFQALGYVDARCTAHDCLFPAGTTYRGHEFHYTRLNVAPDVRYALELERGSGIEDGKDGIHLNNVLAGYTHAYFTDRQASGLVETIRRVHRA